MGIQDFIMDPMEITTICLVQGQEINILEMAQHLVRGVEVNIAGTVVCLVLDQVNMEEIMEFLALAIMVPFPVAEQAIPILPDRIPAVMGAAEVQPVITSMQALAPTVRLRSVCQVQRELLLAILAQLSVWYLQSTGRLLWSFPVYVPLPPFSVCYSR